jgi:hypothetical protein
MCCSEPGHRTPVALHACRGATLRVVKLLNTCVSIQAGIGSQIKSESTYSFHVASVTHEPRKSKTQVRRVKNGQQRLATVKALLLYG